MVRRSIGFGVLAIFAAGAAAAGACAPAAAGGPQEERVAIARSGHAADPAPPIILARADWEGFLAESRAARASAARAAAAAAEARLRTALEEAVAAMRAEIPTFVGWRFSFFTTYRLTFTALGGAVTGNDPELAVRSAVAERFHELVLNAGTLRARLSRTADDITLDVARQRDAFAAERRAALERLADERALPPPETPITTVVSESDALELPPVSPLRPALPIPDPTSEVGWLGQREALVMAGRQAARRGTGLVAEPMVLAAVPASMLEAAPLLVAPAAGAVVFGAGVAVEFVAVKLWEASEREALEEAAHQALSRYHDELAATARPAADAIVAGSFGASGDGRRPVVP